MKNPSLYIGFTLVSDEADGHRRVSTTDGLAYHGMDGLQVTLVQDILNGEFGQRFDALKHDIRTRMVELGYGAAVQEGAEVAEVEKAKGLANKGNRPA
jgi:hypothetical protein